MSTENIHIESIDRYLSGEMPERERVDFENRMAIDGNLADKVKEAELVNEAVHYASLAALREEVGKDIKKIRYKQRPTHIKTSILILVALGLGVLSIDYFQSDTEAPPSIKEVAQTNSVAEPFSSVGDTTPKHEHAPVVAPIAPGLQKANQLPNNKRSDASAPNPSDEADIFSSPPRSDTTTDSDTTPAEKHGIPLSAPAEPPAIPTEISLSAVKATGCEKAYQIKSAPSCRDRSTGTISVILTNNARPALSIDHYGGSPVNGIFNELPAGIHSVSISYGDECHFTEEVIIEEKWCPLNKPSYSFNPDYGERWEIAYEKGDAGTFSIFTSGGKEVYKSDFGQGDEYWAGHDAYGTLSGIGTFLVIIQYKDGRTEKVELTIVR